mgnify:CR=1 FL=1
MHAALPSPHQAPSPAPLFVRPDVWVVGLLLLAVAVRMVLWLGGWSPLDGDEAIMGLMGRHLAEGRGITTWFWGQHYMGTLEVPGIALLMLPGGEAWRASVWPLRGAAILYLLALMWLHGRLAGRLAGPIAERCTLLLLAVGPFAWLDYSMRMRHAPLMMAMGALILHLTLDLIEQRRRPTLPLMMMLGFLVGLGWWHYPLIIIYLLTALAMFVTLQPLALAEILGISMRREGPPSFRTLAPRLAIIAGIAAATGYLALVISGTGNEAAVARGSYRPLIAPALMLILVLSAVLLAFDSAGSRCGQLAPQNPSLPFVGAILGVLMGISPGLIYFFLLREIPIIDLGQLDPRIVIEGLRAVMLVELPVILGIMRPAASFDAPQIGPHGVAVFLIFATALYLFLRLVPTAPLGNRRLGLVAACLVAAAVAFNAMSTRSGDTLIPRFFIPVMGGLALGFGCVGATLLSGLSAPACTASLAGVAAVLIALSAGSVIGWPRESMDIATGHRRHVAQIAHHLSAVADGQRAGVRLDFIDTHVNHSVMLGYELQYASLGQIRVAPGTLLDRLHPHHPAPAADAPAFTLIDEGAQDYLSLTFGLTESTMFPAEARASRLSFGAWRMYPGNPGEALARLRQIEDQRRIVFRPDGTMVLMERAPSGEFRPPQFLVDELNALHPATSRTP